MGGTGSVRLNKAGRPPRQFTPIPINLYVDTPTSCPLPFPCLPCPPAWPPRCVLQLGWTINGAYIEFTPAGAGAQGKALPPMAMDLINNALVYAKELDRIV